MTASARTGLEWRSTSGGLASRNRNFGRDGCSGGGEEKRDVGDAEVGEDRLGRGERHGAVRRSRQFGEGQGALEGGRVRDLGGFAGERRRPLRVAGGRGHPRAE